VSTTLERLSAALADRYRIERELGAGGMATVFLAEDVRHRRRVALKVLHAELSAVLGTERFLKEIELTAGLQHPHILPLFDSGSAEGHLFYVMPFVEGETLRRRLERERQLPVDEALRIAREVADALQYAHDRAVIHRDIKPENILLQGGHAVVADFGIALAVEHAGGQRMTQTGLSLGTPHYMAPEQAMGDKHIDGRADVYALGAVTYEMLAGEPPFTGPTPQAIVARLLTEPVRPVTASRPAVPAHVDAAVRVALEKLPADRFARVVEFSEALRGGTFTHVAATTRVSVARTPSPAARFALPVGAALAVLGLAAAVWAWRITRQPPAAPVVQLIVEPPNANPDLGRFAVSGDGARFAFTTDEGIALRDVGQREYRLLTGTDRAESPSFSPDGEWIVYHVNGHLQKVSVAGGSPLPVLSSGDSLRSGRVSWGEDGSIVFESGFRLYVIPPDGGAPRLLEKALGAEQPRMMPDGSGVLYIDQRQGARLMYYDLAADSAFTAVESAGAGQYLPTGHIVYAMSTGGLFTVPFDPKRPTKARNPTPILADIQPNGGISPFTVTRNGTLVYRAGVDPEYRLLVRQPNGKVDSLPMAPKVLSYARYSPDGRSLAITIGSARGPNRHTAIYDLSRGTLTRFTVDGGGHAPVWSPDGTRIAFTAEAQGTDAEDLFVQSIDRSMPPRRLVRLPNDQHASAWPADTMLVFSNNNAPRTLGGVVGGGNVGIVNPVPVEAPARPYLSAQWGQFDAAVSPDGQWAAFTSDESGRSEVFVRRFPVADAGGVWKVSSGGGYRARWSGDGRTIYYHTIDNQQVRAVRVTPGSTFAVGASETIMTVSAMGSAWDVDRRSGRLVVSEPVSSARARIVVMQHWLDDFRRGASGTAPGRRR